MQKLASAKIILSINAQKVLFNDVYQRRQIEACGLLTGQIDQEGNWYIDQVHPLNNTYNSPVYFEFAPEEMLEVELAFPGQVVGVYHSHPTGMAVASQTDRSNMKRVNVEQQIPWVWLILVGPFGEPFSPTVPVNLPVSSIIAYHYYENQGLQRIPLLFEEAHITTKPENP